MANFGKSKSVTLEELVIGKLPDRVLSAIDQMEITIADVAQWEASKPSMRVMARDGRLVVDLKVRWQIKKLLMVIGGLGGFLWAITNVIVSNLPQIQALFH